MPSLQSLTSRRRVAVAGWCCGRAAGVRQRRTCVSFEDVSASPRRCWVARLFGRQPDRRVEVSGGRALTAFRGVGRGWKTARKASLSAEPTGALFAVQVGRRKAHENGARSSR